MKNLKSNIDYFDESSTTLAYFKDKKIMKRPIPIDLQSTKTKVLIIMKKKQTPPAKQQKIEYYSKRQDKYILFRQYKDEEVFDVIPKGLISRKDETQDDDRDSTEADIQYGINLFKSEIKFLLRQERMTIQTRQRSKSPLNGARQRNQRNRSIL
ncbi:hypothetical protein pb186bvf_011024 [Paramecium bursaria]